MYLSISDLNKYMPKVDGVVFAPFILKHAIDIEGGEFSGYSTQRMIGVKAMLETQAKYGFAYTCFLHGEPVAVFGCSLLWGGVGEMWSVIGNVARTKPIAMTKIGIAFADISEIAMGLHRLQITVKTSDIRAMNWARAIGFISECTMKQYSEDKEDFNLMIRR
jgi:hypothetical protein